MKAAAGAKSKIGVYLGIASAVLCAMPIILALFLIMAVAGGAAAEENSSTYTNKVPGVYPPNGMQIPMYYQWHYTGAQYAFGGGDIGTSGCGPTSFAMVVTYLLGEKITPPDVVKWAGARTYYSPGVGTSWNFFTDAVANYKCGNMVQTTDAQAVLKALSENRPVISSQRRGIFTSQGHFIVLRGITADGKVLVNDPNDNATKNFINREFNMATEVHATSNAYWIFDKRKVPEGGATGAYGSDTTDYSREELELIWAIVQQEDNGSYEGALAVISCAMNRVDSSKWSYAGNNALKQLTAPGQFCYSIDNHWRKWLGGNAYDYVKKAVDDCLNKGIRNHGYTSFRSRQGSETGTAGAYVGGNYYFN